MSQGHQVRVEGGVASRPCGQGGRLLCPASSWPQPLLSGAVFSSNQRAGSLTAGRTRVCTEEPKATFLLPGPPQGSPLNDLSWFQIFWGLH